MKNKFLGEALGLAIACAVVGVSHIGMASGWQKPVYVPSDGSSKGARVTYEYKDDSLFRVNTKLGFVNDIELRPGEVVTHIAGGDTKRWLIDKAIVGNVQHVYIKPIEPDIDTNIIINTNQRAYRLYVVASDTYDPLVSFTFPDSSSGNRLRVPEDDRPVICARVNRNYEIRVKKKADKSLIPLEIFDDGRQTFIRMSKDNKYDLPVLYNIDPWNKKNISMINYRVDGDYFIADGVFPHGRLFYQQKFWIDFFNLEKKPTVKGTMPANRSAREARTRVRYDDDPALDTPEADVRAQRMEEERRKEAAALRKQREKEARIRERQERREKAAMAAKEEARRKEIVRQHEEVMRQQAARKEAVERQRVEAARNEQLAREEAARRQQAAQQAEVARKRQAAEQEAARRQAMARQQYIRQQAAQRAKMEEAQRLEDERRQKQAEEQMANGAEATYRKEAARVVPEPDAEEEVQPVDKATKEKIFRDAVRRQQAYDRMYMKYRQDKKAGEGE